MRKRNNELPVLHCITCAQVHSTPWAPKGHRLLSRQVNREHPAPSLTTVSMGHHKHWSGSRLTAYNNTTVVYAYILMLHFPCGCWHHHRAQAHPWIHCIHPTALPSPPALKGWSQVITKLPATPCSFFLSQGDKTNKQTTIKPQKTKRLLKRKTKPFRQIVSASTVTSILDALWSCKDCWLTFSPW